MHFESFLSQKKPFSGFFLHRILRLFNAILPLSQTLLVSNQFSMINGVKILVKPVPDMHVEPSHSIDSTPSGLVIFGHFSKAAEFLTPAGNPQPVYGFFNPF